MFLHEILYFSLHFLVFVESTQIYLKCMTFVETIFIGDAKGYIQ